MFVDACAIVSIMAGEDTAPAYEAALTRTESAFTSPMAAWAWERWTPENTVTISGPEGVAVRITTRVVAPFDGQTVTFTHTFTGDHAALPQVSQSTLLLLDRGALETLLRDAGFAIEQPFGDFDGGPLGENSPEIITIARAV
jgi:hypothetical protein